MKKTNEIVELDEMENTQEIEVVEKKSIFSKAKDGVKNVKDKCPNSLKKIGKIGLGVAIAGCVYALGKKTSSSKNNESFDDSDYKYDYDISNTSSDENIDNSDEN